MIGNVTEYERAQEELQLLEQRLARLQKEAGGTERGFTKAGIRKMIARLHEELAIYEGERELPSHAN